MAAPLILAGLITLAVSATAQLDPLPPITESALDEVASYLEMRLSEVDMPGLAAAVVHNSDIVSIVELGEASPGVPMTADTQLFIASVSKSITAMALMQQVEVGQVDLDDAVTAYLPELAPEGESVTLRDLLHHRSGLTTYVGNEAWAGDLGSSLEVNVERLVTSLETDASYEYSNANYDALALIVERVSGIPFGEYVANEIFAPLEMDNSYVGPVTAGRDVAPGHYHWLLLGYRPFEQPTPGGMLGSATIFSTAADLAHFMIAHLQGGMYEGNRVVSEASIQRLHTPESIGIDLPEGYPVDLGYAGGLFVDASFDPAVAERLAKMVTLFHDGGALGYRAVLWMIPEANLGFVALTNGNNLADESWLPQVAQGVKHILFGLDPRPIEIRTPWLLRYGKQLLLAVVAFQLILASLTIRAFRGRGSAWLNRTLIFAASVIDLTAIVLILWLIPNTGEAPLRVALQAPDLRILVAAMSFGVLWGLYRSYVLIREVLSSGKASPAEAT